VLKEKGTLIIGLTPDNQNLTKEFNELISSEEDRKAIINDKIGWLFTEKI